ncbi:TrbI/VirB10 family protein [Pseudomonas juntendi]|uniref:TrbI/VirB10 family protein n=1 Tax=Pseudomonas juntendi TaxID=2666183 RepID=UPI003B949EC5
MTNSDQMSPDASPSTEGNKSGVRRVNNLPIILAVGALVIFALIVMKVAVGRSEEQAAVKPPEGAEARNENSTRMANELLGNRTAGVIDAAEPPTLYDEGTTIPVLGHPAANNGVPVAPVTDPDRPPVPRRPNRVPQPDPVDDDLRQRKMDLFAQAVGSKTKIDLPDMASLAATSGGAGSTTPRTTSEIQARIAQVRREIESQHSNDPGETYQAKLRQIQAQINSGGGAVGDAEDGPGMSLLSGSRNQSQGYEAFDSKGNPDRWALDAKIEAPGTPYEVSAGDVIPGMMISGLKTSRTGQIIGQVSQNVYDSQSGCHLLIPSGTRLVGTYSNDMGFGEETVLVAWQRLRFPDGSKLDIGAMPGADMAGYSGFQDLVDRHLLRIYTSAILMSGITAAASIATNQDNNSGEYEQPSVNSELSSALGQQLGQVSAQIISKNLNVAPTATIRPGYRFNIMVVKDLKLNKPYKTSSRCAAKF